MFREIESGDHCHGKGGHCKAMERVIAALDYHQFMIVNELSDKYGDEPTAAFISFCQELYPKDRMLNDYIHFVLHHADPDSIEYIRGRLHFPCDSAKNCGATSRHYRDRRGDATKGAKGTKTNWFIDRIDTIHFMVNHLTELGLRVPSNVLESAFDWDDEKGDESQKALLVQKRMKEVVDSKRREFSDERLDGAENAKFTLTVTEQSVISGTLMFLKILESLCKS